MTLVETLEDVTVLLKRSLIELSNGLLSASVHGVGWTCLQKSAHSVGYFKSIESKLSEMSKTHAHQRKNLLSVHLNFPQICTYVFRGKDGQENVPIRDVLEVPIIRRRFLQKAFCVL